MQFKDVIGHENVKQRLINTVKEGRISHAQLFLGKEGFGNLPIAIAYAQYISCQNRSDIDSCGECPSCIKFQKLVHPDLHFVFPVATNKVIKKDPLSSKYMAEWRELILDKKGYISLPDLQNKIDSENKQLLIPKGQSLEIVNTLSLKTYESEYKIMIIWSPEKFHQSAANALLKIIEEPPSKTLFILVAYDIEQIIPTILSRTQLVKIGRIKEDVLEKELIKRYTIDKIAAKSVARLSDGNFIQAKKIIEQSEREKLFYSLFTSWMRSAFIADVAALIICSEEIAKVSFGREKQKQFLNYSLHIFRESLIKNYGSSNLERVAKNEEEFLVKFAPYIHGANCIEVIKLFNDASYHIERNINPKILFLDVSLKLTKLLRVKAPVEV
jgi:DNA polymerase-3 subunit delta'